MAQTDFQKRKVQQQRQQHHHDHHDYNALVYVMYCKNPQIAEGNSFNVRASDADARANAQSKA